MSTNSADWTFGASWSIDNGILSYDGANNSNPASLSVPLTIGNEYAVIFDLDGLSSGNGLIALAYLDGTIIDGYDVVADGIAVYRFTATKTNGIRFLGRVNNGAFDLLKVAIIDLTEFGLTSYSDSELEDLFNAIQYSGLQGVRPKVKIEKGKNKYIERNTLG